MRLYRNLVAAAVSCLHDIFIKDLNPESTLRDRTKKNRSWGSRDRRFLQSIVYDVIRSMRLYVHVLNKRPVSIDDFTAITAIYLIDQQIDLPDWDDFSSFDAEDILSKLELSKNIRHLQFAIPEWLDSLGYSYYKEQWNGVLEKLEDRAPVFIRINRSKTDRKSLIKKLTQTGISVSLVNDVKYESALQIDSKARLTSLPIFNEGHFEIQDLSSQMIAPYMELSPEMIVIDACAGAGGKMLHIADIMDNKGSIHCFDIHAVKLKNLQKRARRTHVNIYQTHLVPKIKHWDSFNELADRVLIDAPCTGLGTIRRKPILKWRLNERWYRSILKSQQQVFQQYAPMCKRDGLLIYATCSILPSENNEQVQHFLETSIGRSFELVDQLQILPSSTGGDGFYMAKLKRNDL